MNKTDDRSEQLEKLSFGELGNELELAKIRGDKETIHRISNLINHTPTYEDELRQRIANQPRY